jgi:hypothetical protein
MILLKLPKHVALLAGLLSAATLTLAQQSPNPVTTAVPILTLSPDARSAALGEAGVALSPDANAAYYNAGKLGFVPNSYSFSPSYTPWLRSLSPRGGLAYFSGYARLSPRSTLAASLLYFNPFGTPRNTPGQWNGHESAVSVSYGQALNEHLGLGATVRYIRSTLTGNNLGGSNAPTHAAAIDLGVYYHKQVTVGARQYTLGLGASLSNAGSRMRDTAATLVDILPTNLKIGTAITRAFSASNKLTLVVDANKLVVPTPYYITGSAPSSPAVVAQNQAIANQPVIRGMIRSFSDAPGGVQEELREITLSTGLEYSHKDIVFVRTGYFYENPKKGNRQYLSVGGGLRYHAVGIDGAYMIPNSQANPLAQTIRLSLHLNVNKRGGVSPGQSTTPTS